MVILSIAAFIYAFILGTMLMLRCSFWKKKAVEHEATARRALQLGEQANALMLSTLKEIQEMQQRNVLLQDILLQEKKNYIELLHDKKADLLFGNPFTWMGGQQANKSIHFTITSPKVTK